MTEPTEEKNQKSDLVRRVVGAVEHSAPDGPRKSITKIGRDLIEQMAAKGASWQNIATALRIDTKTLRRCRKEDERVQAAYDKGKGADEAEIASVLRELALSKNLIACIFYLKSRHGWVEGQAPADQRPNITITLPAALDTHAYTALIGARVEGGEKRSQS